MQSLNNILKVVREYIKEPVTTDWDSVNKWLNMGIDNLSQFCPHPDCKKRGAFKSFHGRKIHMAKIHGWTKKAEKEYIKKHLFKETK